MPGSLGLSVTLGHTSSPREGPGSHSSTWVNRVGTSLRSRSVDVKMTYFHSDAVLCDCQVGNIKAFLEE